MTPARLARLAQWPLKPAARWMLNRLLARATRMRGTLAWVTTHPNQTSLTLDHLALDPELAVVAEGTHPAFERVRESLRRAAAPGESILDRIEARRRAALANHSAIIGMDGFLRRSLDEPRTLQDDCAILSVPHLLARFLHHLVRQVRPALCLELGTGHGISTLYLLAGLERTGHGHLYTIDGDPVRRRLALENVGAIFPSTGRLTSLEGLFADVLPGVLEKLPGPLDFVFEDGDHFPDATLACFELVFPRLSPGAILILDDVYHRNGTLTAWTAIRHHPGVAASLEINGRFGLCIKG